MVGAVGGLVGGMLAATLAASPQAGAATSASVACGQVYGPGGLVDAINEANAAGGGTINLARGCTYTLTVVNHGDDGLPDIESPITINGSGAAIVRKSTAEFRILHVEDGSLTLNSLTVSGGRTDLGGGIANEAALVINGGQLSGNTANAFGGGIYNAAGTVSVTSSRVTDNTAEQDGGGIDQSGTQLTLTASQVSGNQAGGFGGGIDNGGRLDVTSSQVNGNAGLLGAGIANENDATPGAAMATVTSTQVYDNTASSPIGSPPFGGGLLNGVESELTLISTQVSGNTVTAPASTAKGGGIVNRGELSIQRSSVSANTASATSGTAQGGGILNDGDGTVTLTSSLVGSNRAVAKTAEGGGIFNSGSTVNLAASLVGGNAPDNCFPAHSVAGCTG